MLRSIAETIHSPSIPADVETKHRMPPQTASPFQVPPRNGEAAPEWRWVSLPVTLPAGAIFGIPRRTVLSTWAPVSVRDTEEPQHDS